MKSEWKGHLGALLTILIWGTTFVSTKVLLDSFSPVALLLLRFGVAILALSLLRPRRLRMREKKHHLYFLAAGVSGVTLYFLAENIALTYTSASNVGVIVSASPLFMALLLRVLFKERLRPTFYIGFVGAIAGIGLISFAGSRLQLNPLGDLLALAAAACWAVYSLLVRKIGSLGYDNILVTRRIFVYGLICMLPAAALMGAWPDVTLLARPENLLNVLYLGVGASALCFLTWNFAVKTLGTIKTGAYIYAVPVVAVVCSAILLGEVVTPAKVAGIGLTLLGLVVSEMQFGKPGEAKSED